MPRVAVRMSDEDASSLEELVASGVFASRSEALRAGLDLILERHRREAVGAAIVAGYERVPPMADDGMWSDEATRAMIADEPW